MDVVITKLLDVVEHIAYSHTFKSEAVANEVRQLLSEARAALDAPAAAPSSPAEAPAAPADPTNGASEPVSSPPSADSAATVLGGDMNAAEGLVSG